MDTDKVKVRITETILVAFMFAGFIGALCELLSLGDVSLQSGPKVAYAAAKEMESENGLAKCSDEITVEDGVLHIDTQSSKGAATYSSDSYSVKVVCRQADKFTIIFISLNDVRDISPEFQVSLTQFHRLAEMFDVTHVRRAGGII